MSIDEENKNCKLYLENELLAPYTYLLQVRGKQLRLKIPLAFNHWLKAPNDKVHDILDAVNTIHVGSLLIDDIQDDSKARRGMPAAHLVYGVPLAINTFLHVACLTFQRFNNITPEGGKIIVEQLLDASRGQGRDIYWRENFICPTEDQYLTMVEQKTGAMLMTPILMMQLFSDSQTDYSKLVYLLARYFQIRDDYCNLIEQDELEEWPTADDKVGRREYTYCEDITEGKYSWPVIHAMKTSLAEEVMGILRQRTNDTILKKHCVTLLERAGSLQYTRDKLAELDREARAEVVRLGGNPMMETVLDQLLSWKS